MSDHGHLQEANDFISGHPDTQAIDLLISDLNGIARGKRIDKSALTKVYQNGYSWRYS